MLPREKKVLQAPRDGNEGHERHSEANYGAWMGRHGNVCVEVSLEEMSTAEKENQGGGWRTENRHV
jgi:hypothetical protein